MWIGEFDKEKLEFTGNGEHYHFPRSDYCEQIYCNIEGDTACSNQQLLRCNARSFSQLCLLETQRSPAIQSSLYDSCTE